MPQLSPMSWVVVFLSFLICWVVLMVTFWWGAGGGYKISCGSVIKGGGGSKIGWKFNSGLKSNK
uniref:ATP synthase F0 subunit 8 n=1 Tax=Potomida littoralis TaxID=165005 RepID=A0A0U2S9G7_9BIVA|nr:ATP synthase F0 subunit 8 [Potomida littoralis]ALQ78678.1 ATP synthase F0 subunit 8 [Potomida littoralis]